MTIWLRTACAVQLDVKQNIGKRYARMDEAGCPFCFTIDASFLASVFRSRLVLMRLPTA